ncbi:MAG TPA: aminoacetone oxidase family FAD-binding enzyme, partial [Clostridia bacterium]|nr:aminoacetone oxidase family FAD-binding enzyme [Clostridia bacterium]
MSTPKHHVIIIGGGAAGMLAAISARRKGSRVTILERNPRIGKKILATGNGRCNFANVNTDINCYHGNNPPFARQALTAFSVRETMDFFAKLGVTPKVEDQGKVFPMSDQASSVLDVLRYELDITGVQIICDAYVEKIVRGKNRLFQVQLANQETLEGNRVIIATGGKAMPSTGSDGNGYNLARQLGHSITGIFPSLVQIKLEGKFFHQIQGVKLVGTAEILEGNTPVAKDRGDILFANYGVSGPPILQISRKAGELLQENKEAILKIVLIDTIPKD